MSKSDEMLLNPYDAQVGSDGSESFFVFQKITEEGFKVPRFDLNVYQLAPELDHDWLDTGRNELIKLINTVKGQLTQDIYELISSNTLSTQTLLECCDKVTAGTVENKFVLLKRRYSILQGNVVDHKREDLPVIEPDLVFDVIMAAHLINGHLPWRKIHQHLKNLYANVTRDFTNLVTLYCSHCNTDRNMKRFLRYKHYNVYDKVMPLERCHVEIFAPFDDDGNEKIEDKYSHVLYCRDYHSRFVWMLPLEGITFRDLVPALTQLLCSMIRLPIFLETATLDRQDMFDVCEYIARKYKLKIGLGLNSGTDFQRNGVTRIKNLFAEHKEQCIKEWNMCLRLVLTRVNQNYSDRVRGIPSDLLCNEISNIAHKFKLKQRKIIDELYAHHVVQFREAGGMIYLEDDNSAFVVDEDEHGPENDNVPVTESPSKESMKSSNNIADNLLEPNNNSSIPSKRVLPSEKSSIRKNGSKKKINKEKVTDKGKMELSSPLSQAGNQDFQDLSEIPEPSSPYFRNTSISQRSKYADVSIEL
ncbi:replication fork barrier binding protein FOB1 Ecym_4308 [Eremothecium cymbalariae DBVPG|uniref:Uncharacterized protein n=1 Tax=Eremothecium cymbalariae (strain CBS 270.75 / DBVPG 7215 / KCTC 17166 / NRRL Y-17582) TaxID=931890 RepID=G8JTL8_ERECY|nr:hypothetical protein Ecym_4308 [Eremothecium cymbalariae DBVPG\